MLIFNYLFRLDMNRKRYVLEVSQTYENDLKNAKEKMAITTNEGQKIEKMKCPKLRMCVQSFIPQHLKKKIEIKLLNNEEEKNVNNKQLTSFAKQSNITLIVNETNKP